MCSYVRYDMLLCRRLLFTADPQYPAVTFFAKLPSLVFHINEHKVGVVTDFEIIKVFQQDYVHFLDVTDTVFYCTWSPKFISSLSEFCLLFWDILYSNIVLQLKGEMFLTFSVVAHSW